jgi:hypothetical protein
MTAEIGSAISGGELARLSHPCLLRAKRHRCPQIPSREWGVQGLPPAKGRERNAERRILTAPRLISRIAGKQRHTATPLGVPLRLFCPWDRASGTGASKLAIQAGFRPPFTCPVQPLQAAPRSGHGRLPKASRVRRERPPRPQAPHPAPRYKRPGNAPLTGTG